MTPPPPSHVARGGVGTSGPWQRATGVVRLALLCVVAFGTYLIHDYEEAEQIYLFGFYCFGFASAIGHLFVTQTRVGGGALITWAQVLVDFGVIAATVSFTGGAQSNFSFLFVIAILEAGVLLGLAEGLLVATLAAGVMAVLFVTTPAPAWMQANRSAGFEVSTLTVWYGFLVQTLAYYLTAAISGYWNQQLHKLQQFQREILDNMNNGFIISDMSGIITVINKAAERILNIREEEALGKPVQEILRVASGEQCPVITALRSDRDFTRYEYVGLVFPHTAKLLGLSTSRIFDWRKRTTGIIASFSDLTELEQMREEVKRHDRLAVTGELAAGLAHEIRNPVAAIRGAVDELMDCLDKPALVTKLATIAMRESDQLNAIVSDFLDFARKPRVRKEMFDVCGLAREVSEATQHKYSHAKELRIAVTLPEGVCPVSGDRTQVRQVFVNLAKNAIEAMEEKGTLQVTVAPGPTYVEIRFEDEGPGVDPDKVARIFEPFYTTKEHGVGMGLAICMRIITAHDGTIRASSREGGGTSMIVRLPLVRAEE
ncbi:MAG TPA: ATP-binding protein [Candidatus Hydrogenedentes bacterium]|nr:ATP-binding protein [Candidatus Hydrogenedentota bacterium]HRK35195.1 ATP-binding protein [Candidatus Hydrogenedentota bacterium]